MKYFTTMLAATALLFTTVFSRKLHEHPLEDHGVHFKPSGNTHVDLRGECAINETPAWISVSVMRDDIHNHTAASPYHSLELIKETMVEIVKYPYLQGELEIARTTGDIRAWLDVTITAGPRDLHLHRPANASALAEDVDEALTHIIKQAVSHPGEPRRFVFMRCVSDADRAPDSSASLSLSSSWAPPSSSQATSLRVPPSWTRKHRPGITGLPSSNGQITHSPTVDLSSVQKSSKIPNSSPRSTAGGSSRASSTPASYSEVPAMSPTEPSSSPSKEKSSWAGNPSWRPPHVTVPTSYSSGSDDGKGRHQPGNPSRTSQSTAIPTSYILPSGDKNHNGHPVLSSWSSVSTAVPGLYPSHSNRREDHDGGPSKGFDSITVSTTSKDKGHHHWLGKPSRSSESMRGHTSHPTSSTEKGHHSRPVKSTSSLLSSINRTSQPSPSNDRGSHHDRPWRPSWRSITVPTSYYSSSASASAPSGRTTIEESPKHDPDRSSGQKGHGKPTWFPGHGTKSTLKTVTKSPSDEGELPTFADPTSSWAGYGTKIETHGEKLTLSGSAVAGTDGSSALTGASTVASTTHVHRQPVPIPMPSGTDTHRVTKDSPTGSEASFASSWSKDSGKVSSGITASTQPFRESSATSLVTSPDGMMRSSSTDAVLSMITATSSTRPVPPIIVIPVPSRKPGYPKPPPDHDKDQPKPPPGHEDDGTEPPEDEKDNKKPPPGNDRNGRKPPGDDEDGKHSKPPPGDKEDNDPPPGDDQDDHDPPKDDKERQRKPPPGDDEDDQSKPPPGDKDEGGKDPEDDKDHEPKPPSGGDKDKSDPPEDDEEGKDIPPPPGDDEDNGDPPKGDKERQRKPPPGNDKDGPDSPPDHDKDEDNDKGDDDDDDDHHSGGGGFRWGWRWPKWPGFPKWRGTKIPKIGRPKIDWPNIPKPPVVPEIPVPPGGFPKIPKPPPTGPPDIPLPPFVGEPEVPVPPVENPEIPELPPCGAVGDVQAANATLVDRSLRHGRRAPPSKGKGKAPLRVDPCNPGWDSDDDFFEIPEADEPGPSEPKKPRPDPSEPDLDDPDFDEPGPSEPKKPILDPPDSDPSEPDPVDPNPEDPDFEEFNPEHLEEELSDMCGDKRSLKPIDLQGGAWSVLWDAYWEKGCGAQIKLRFLDMGLDHRNLCILREQNPFRKLGHIPSFPASYPCTCLKMSTGVGLPFSPNPEVEREISGYMGDDDPSWEGNNNRKGKGKDKGKDPLKDIEIVLPYVDYKLRNSAPIEVPLMTKLSIPAQSQLFFQESARIVFDKASFVYISPDIAADRDQLEHGVLGSWFLKDEDLWITKLNGWVPFIINTGNKRADFDIRGFEDDDDTDRMGQSYKVIAPAGTVITGYSGGYDIIRSHAGPTKFKLGAHGISLPTEDEQTEPTGPPAWRASERFNLGAEPKTMKAVMERLEWIGKECRYADERTLHRDRMEREEREKAWKEMDRQEEIRKAKEKEARQHACKMKVVDQYDECINKNEVILDKHTQRCAGLWVFLDPRCWGGPGLKDCKKMFLPRLGDIMENPCT